MNDELFEQLLYEEESTSLDFKKEQYRFVKATNDDKSELLKDILGMANAWRRTDAYILIGVEEVRGGRSNVVGISAADQLNDHSLQQFVNSLTNRPLRFHYEVFSFEGKQVGIIRIENQPRPSYLKRDYGKLKQNEVFVRRGSSTDPKKPASPEEIAQMGHGAGPECAELTVDFADTAREQSVGSEIAWSVEFCEMPAAETIPDLRDDYNDISLPNGISIPGFRDPTLSENTAYFRELATFEFCRRLFRPARFVISNVGKTAAKNVRAEFVIPASCGVVLMENSELPKAPSQYRNLLASSALEGLRPARHEPGDVEVDSNHDRYRVVIECGDLQPGRKVWSEPFYVGVSESRDVLLVVSVFADNLPEPKEITLKIAVSVTRAKITLDDICSLSKTDDEPG